MKIVITGVAGFLGSHLADALSDHEIIGIDNLVGGYKENVPNSVIFYQADTADLPKMDRILRQHKPDVVYHCACTAYEGLSVFSPHLITKNTFTNTTGILTASIKNKVKRFIYCSSMSRYGANPVPFTEDMTPEPEDPYAVGKVASEMVIKMLAETHGFEYVIAVPHNIIGIRQKYDDPYRNVASIMINRILQGKSPIIYGDGEQVRSFSIIDDCIDILVKMIDCPSGGIYNIGQGENDGTTITINELADTILKLTGSDLKPFYCPGRPREVKKAFCSSAKIQKEFGFKSKTTLEKCLKDMIADIIKNGTKPFDYHLPLEITEGCPETWTKKTI